MSIVWGYEASAVFLPEARHNTVWEKAQGVPLARRAAPGSVALSLEELWLLNSVLDRQDPFGISLEFQHPLATRAYRHELQATKNSLIQKGILLDKARFSPLGVVVTRALREYKAALRHVFIDDARIAVTPEGFCIILRKEPRGCYDLHVMPKDRLRVMLGMSFPCLRREILTKGAQVRPLIPRTHDPLRVRVYQRREMISYCTFSPDSFGCTHFDHRSRLAQRLSPQDIWRALDRSLG